MKLDNNTCKSLCYISSLFILTNITILFLSGSWFDEKVWFLSDSEVMKEISMQLGKPSTYYIFLFFANVPERLGRVIVFLTFYASTIGFFYILRHVNILNTTDATLITLIYIASPINDVRGLFGVYPYSLGYFLFILGFCFMLRYLNGKHLSDRWISVFLFYGSFSLNSLLVFYSLPCLYIFTFLIRNREVRLWFKYLDYLSIPFLFFIIKSRFFIPYGIYSGYNSVSVSKMIQSLTITFRLCFLRMEDVIKCWIKALIRGGALSVIVVVSLLVLLMAVYHKLVLKDDESNNYFIKIIFMVTLGFIALYLGIYPYVVIGQNCSIIGTSGRSSILLGVGIAFLCYGIILLVPIKKIRLVLCLLICICGFCHLNYYYLLYQQDYYAQLDLEMEICKNKEVIDNPKNILYITDYNSEVECTGFYTLNGNFANALGNQEHFIMNGIGDYKKLNNIELMSVLKYSRYYNMAEYDLHGNKFIEAIALYNNRLSIKKVLLLKLYELTNKKCFYDYFLHEQNLDIIIKGDSRFDSLLNSVAYEYQNK